MKKSKTKISKKGSPVWLIILLCAIILLLYSVITSVRHNDTINALNQQIQGLVEEMEKAQKEKLEQEQKLEQLRKNLISPLATSSAQISTSSGEKE